MSGPQVVRFRPWEVAAVVAAKMRMLLTGLGLEHAGHHVWWSERDKRGALEVASNASRSVGLSMLLVDEFWQISMFSPPRPNKAAAVARIARRMALEGSEKGVTWFPLNSYPGNSRERGCALKDKSCCVPDATVLLEAARQTPGVDLRFILLLRPAADLLLDRMWPESGFTRERVVLLTRACHHLRAQLQKIPRAQVLRMPYAEYLEPSRLEALDAFANTTALSRALRRVYKPRPRAAPPERLRALGDVFPALERCVQRL